MPQLLYLPGVDFNQADGAGDGRSRSVSAGFSPAGYGDRLILAFSKAV